MAYVLDVRNSGGTLVVIGDWMAFPSSGGSAEPVLGAVRFNPDVGGLQVYTRIGELDQWRTLATDFESGDYLSVAGGTVSGTLTLSSGASIRAANGSTANPPYGFTASAGTGIFAVDAQNIGVAVGGELALRIGSEGITLPGSISLGGLTLSVTGGDSLRVSGNGAFGVSIGSTAQRPAPYQGGIRFNTTLGVLETSNAFGWDEVPTKSANDGRYLSLDGGVVTGNVEVVGTVTAEFFDGTSAAAIYAGDLAERYHADADYPPGTVLVIGGAYEVTACTQMADTAVVGVVSTRPAYPMNIGAGPDSTHPMIALRGRVPCKVVGPVRKGALVVSSAVTGHAMSAPPDAHPSAVIGRALHDFEGDLGVVEIVV